MHVGALCLSLCDLALHHPPYTCFGQGLAGRFSALRAPGALAPSTKVGQIESLGLCQSRNVQLFLVREWCMQLLHYLDEVLGGHFRGCRSDFMTALCACPGY